MSTVSTCPSPEAMAAPTMPICNGKMNSQSRKILAAAPAHMPAKDSVGEPSFRTNTDRQVPISMGTEKAEYQQLKELGVVHSAKEFIQLFHPDEQEDTP